MDRSVSPIDRTPFTLKRARPNEERDAKFYFMGGDIVLSAPDKGGIIIYFRVHASKLSQFSAVFRDKLAAMTAHDATLYDDVALVELNDDADDLRDFINVLYGPLFNNDSWSSTVKASVYAPALKLAIKYQADALIQRLTPIVAQQWPNKLDDWDKLEDDMGTTMKNTPPGTTISDISPDPASAIRLGRDYNLPHLLPIAFYHLSRLSTDADSDKVGDDWQPPVLAGSFWTVRPRRGCLARRSILSSDDKEILALGRERMTRWLAKQAWQVFHRWGCQSGKCYDLGVYTFWCELQMDVMTRMDILSTLRDTMKRVRNVDSNGGYVCSQCRVLLESKLGDIREKFFTILPLFFGLGPWDSEL